MLPKRNTYTHFTPHFLRFFFETAPLKLYLKEISTFFLGIWLFPTKKANRLTGNWIPSAVGKSTLNISCL